MHIHAVTVNLTKDGRLSAKEIIGNKKVMQERQDRYAAAVQKFGLMRGERNTGIKHEDAKEYYKRIQSSLDHSKQSVAELEAKRSVLLTRKIQSKT
jgi:predicted solute-binding protein